MAGLVTLISSWLLASCIIYYNATILSRVLEERRAVGGLAGVAQLTQVRPWPGSTSTSTAVAALLQNVRGAAENAA